MKNQFRRKLHTRWIIFKKRYFTPIGFFKLLTLAIIVFLITPIFLYIIIYNGYSQKLISSSTAIRDELTTGVLISDPNPENLKYLTEVAKDAFQKRKINSIYIFLIGDSKDLIDENIFALLDKVPPSLIKIDRDSETPKEVCDSSKDVYTLSKFLILAFHDIAIRTSFICSNQNIYTQAIIPTTDESTLPISRSGIVDYLKDILYVFAGLKI